MFSVKNKTQFLLKKILYFNSVKKMSGAAALLGENNVLNHSGDNVNASSAFAGKTVGLYFSAHWCPPCRGFTPELAKFYKKHHESKNFEVVFISSDRDEQAFKEYYESMPWLCLDFKQRDFKTELSGKFGVRGIPTLILIDGDSGKVINPNAREEVMDDTDANDFPWKK